MPAHTFVPRVSWRLCCWEMLSRMASNLALHASTRLRFEMGSLYLFFNFCCVFTSVSSLFDAYACILCLMQREYCCNTGQSRDRWYLDHKLWVHFGLLKPYKVRNETIWETIILNQPPEQLPGSWSCSNIYIPTCTEITQIKKKSGTHHFFSREPVALSINIGPGSFCPGCQSVYTHSSIAWQGTHTVSLRLLFYVNVLAHTQLIILLSCHVDQKSCNWGKKRYIWRKLRTVGIAVGICLRRLRPAFQKCKKLVRIQNTLMYCFLTTF
jgi:hypothetical protein